MKDKTHTVKWPVEDVKKYKLAAGAILFLIDSLCEKSRRDNNKQSDGYYWSGPLSHLEISEKTGIKSQTVRTNLKNLIEKGVLQVGNFNKRTYDTTRWYRRFDNLPPIKNIPTPYEKHTPSYKKGGIKNIDTILYNNNILDKDMNISLDNITGYNKIEKNNSGKNGSTFPTFGKEVDPSNMKKEREVILLEQFQSSIKKRLISKEDILNASHDSVIDYLNEQFKSYPQWYNHLWQMKPNGILNPTVHIHNNSQFIIDAVNAIYNVPKEYWGNEHVEFFGEWDF